MPVYQQILPGEGISDKERQKIEAIFDEYCVAIGDLNRKYHGDPINVVLTMTAVSETRIASTGCLVCSSEALAKIIEEHELIHDSETS